MSGREHALQLSSVLTGVAAVYAVAPEGQQTLL